MTLPRRLILAAPALLIGPARAQPAAWTVATEYPATSIPGEGVAHFALARHRQNLVALPGIIIVQIAGRAIELHIEADQHLVRMAR